MKAPSTIASASLPLVALRIVQLYVCVPTERMFAHASRLKRLSWLVERP
jgi:hypothetical protein